MTNVQIAQLERRVTALEADRDRAEIEVLRGLCIDLLERMYGLVIPRTIADADLKNFFYAVRRGNIKPAKAIPAAAVRR
jgi:hypothetical protein